MTSHDGLVYAWRLVYEYRHTHTGGSEGAGGNDVCRWLYIALNALSPRRRRRRRHHVGEETINVMMGDDKPTTDVCIYLLI